MTSRFLCTIPLLVAAFAAGQVIPPNDPNYLGPTLLNTDAIDASDKLLGFSHRLGQQLIANSREKAVVFSPLSIAGSLLMLELGARGRTYDELAQVLGYQPMTPSQTVHGDFERLIGQIVASNSNLNQPEIEHFVQVANALFVQRGFTLRPDYKATVLSVYRAETFTDVDLQSPATLQLVNKWVEERTHGKIRDILTRPLDAQAKLLVASTVYFNAKWQTTFFEEQTKKRPFWIDGRAQPSVQVDMMALGGKFPFADVPEYDCRILGLPYKNSTSTMFVILPNNSSANAVRSLQRRLTGDAINQMIARMNLRTSIVFLPKLHLTATVDLRQELTRLGLTSLFDPFRSDLGLIADAVTDGVQSVVDSFGAVQSAVADFGGALLRPTVSPVHNERDLDKFLIFSRFSDDDSAKTEGDDNMKMTRSKRNTYKTVSADSKSYPLDMKDFILRKRITKENKTGKKSLRHRRSLEALDRKRSLSGIGNPGLFANEIVHKVDLVVNEKGTEGGAATVAFLYKTGTQVMFRAEEPFLFFIRHEQTKLPIFYGAVFDPRTGL